MFRLYNGQHDEEYRLMDSLVEEQYLIGGVDAWLYAYEGPKGNKDSTDLTKPDYETLGSKITDIGNMVWMENSARKYSIDAVTLPIVYQTQDASMDMQIPGLFLFETMDVTLPYNLMIERLGRKVMKGDVLELANLRDAHPLDDEHDAINRFYVVHDAFKSGDGYSHTWFHHIWKLRVVPMTDSPEFSDILGTGENEDDLVNSLSTRQRELDIMDLIVGQADSEVPYMHWDNEHIHKATQVPSLSEVASGYDYPALARDGEYFVLKTLPVLYGWEGDVDGSWEITPTSKGQTYPTDPVDGDFFWHLHFDHVRKLVLTQYNEDTKRWQEVFIPESDVILTEFDEYGYFIKTEPDTPIMIKEANGWSIAIHEDEVKYIDNKENLLDQREDLPDIKDVIRGDQFPQQVPDGTWFMRTDQKPETLWKFENNKWRKFNYGGRYQWTGVDAHKARLLNNRETYTTDDGTVNQSRKASSDVIKPSVDD